MEPYIGQILLVAFTYPPQGWAFCDGTLLNISGNEALYVLLGTAFGGDGVTTFALPDLRGRVPVHVGPNYALGMSAGVEVVTLAQSQMPSHTHSLLAVNAAGNSASPAGCVPAATTDLFYGTGTATQMGTSTLSYGGSQPHENRQPYQVLQYIIATEGVFPSQS